MRLVYDACDDVMDCSLISNVTCHAGGYCKCETGLLPNPALTACFSFQLSVSNCTADEHCLEEAANRFARQVLPVWYTCVHVRQMYTNL